MPPLGRRVLEGTDPLPLHSQHPASHPSVELVIFPPEKIGRRKLLDKMLHHPRGNLRRQTIQFYTQNTQKTHTTESNHHTLSGKRHILLCIRKITDKLIEMALNVVITTYLHNSTVQAMI